MAVFTFVLAFVGIVTLIEIIEGGQDTHALAVAAKTQADKMASMSDAAAKIREASEQMAAHEKEIADKARETLEVNSKQSKAALDSSIAASRLDQRAWISVWMVEGEVIDGGNERLILPSRVFHMRN